MPCGGIEQTLLLMQKSIRRNVQNVGSSPTTATF